MKTSGYIAFFDLDGTVTAVNSGYALVRTARDNKLIAISGVVNAIMLSLVYKLHLSPAKTIINDMGRWLKGMRVDLLTEVANEAVVKYLVGSVYEKAVEEIEYHRSKNAEVALLSSAVSEICSPMAEFLGVQTIICTEMEKVNGLLTGFAESTYCYGDEKARRLHSYCRQRSFDLRDAYYYADSFADIDALEAVGHPVCINPDRILKKTAGERNWQVRTWNSIADKK